MESSAETAEIQSILATTVAPIPTADVLDVVLRVYRTYAAYLLLPVGACAVLGLALVVAADAFGSVPFSEQAFSLLAPVEGGSSTALTDVVACIMVFATASVSAVAASRAVGSYFSMTRLRARDLLMDLRRCFLRCLPVVAVSGWGVLSTILIAAVALQAVLDSPTLEANLGGVLVLVLAAVFGALLFPFVAAAPAILVLEDLPAGRALARSAEVLGSGAARVYLTAWMTGLIMLLVAVGSVDLISSLVGLAPLNGDQTSALTVILTTAALCFLAPLPALLGAVHYVDGRARVEGWDLALRCGE